MNTLDRMVRGARRGVISVLAASALACGGDGPTQPPPPTPVGTIAVSSPTVNPLSVEVGSPVTIAGTAMANTPSGATPVAIDSLVYSVNGGRVGAHAGSTGSVPYTPATAGAYNATVQAFGRNAQSNAPVSGATAFTATPPPPPEYNVRIRTSSLGESTSFGGALPGRVTAIVNGTTLTLPADTTFKRQAGSLTVALPESQAHVYTFGELEADTLWRPYAPNIRSHTIPLTGDVTMDLRLLNKANFTQHMRDQFIMGWERDGYLRPTKRREFEIVVVDSLKFPGTSSAFMPLITENIRAAAIAERDTLAMAENAPDGVRRTYTVTQVADPIAAGKVYQLPNGLWRPQPGVLILGRAPEGGQGNVLHFDSQGFLEAGFMRIPSNWNSFGPETKNWRDFSPGEPTDLALTSQADGGLYRTLFDSFAFHEVMRVAHKAGILNYGLLRGPQ